MAVKTFCQMLFQGFRGDVGAGAAVGFERSAVRRFLGQEDAMDVGKNSSVGNGHPCQQLA